MSRVQTAQTAESWEHMYPFQKVKNDNREESDIGHYRRRFAKIAETPQLMCAKRRIYRFSLERSDLGREPGYVSAFPKLIGQDPRGRRSKRCLSGRTGNGREGGEGGLVEARDKKRENSSSFIKGERFRSLCRDGRKKKNFGYFATATATIIIGTASQAADQQQ